MVGKSCSSLHISLSLFRSFKKLYAIGSIHHSITMPEVHYDVRFHAENISCFVCLSSDVCFVMSLCCFRYYLVDTDREAEPMWQEAEIQKMHHSYISST